MLPELYFFSSVEDRKGALRQASQRMRYRRAWNLLSALWVCGAAVLGWYAPRWKESLGQPWGVIACVALVWVYIWPMRQRIKEKLRDILAS